MKKLNLMLAGLLAFTLFACGSPEPKALVKDGYAALGAGDSVKALANFNAALADLKPENGLYLDAKMGVVEALMPNSPKEAVAEFLVLAKAFPAKIGEKQFINTSGKMVSAGQFSDAVDLVHQGIQMAGGESPTLMAMIERIKKEGASDKGAIDKLQGLGYM